MEQHNNQQPGQQKSEQNPPVNNPVSNISEQGEAPGGLTHEELERQHGRQSDRRGNSSIPLGNDETIGNP